MPDTQLNLFDRGYCPPVGSDWNKISEWVDSLMWVDDIFAAVAFEALGLEDPLSMKFLTHMLWATKVFDRKQQNYGPENIAKMGEDGVMDRVEKDKFSRLKTLNANPDQVLEGEPALDAWHDAAVYGIIGAMVHNGDWPSREELGLDNKTLAEICAEAIEAAADVDNPMTLADALRYIEDNLV